MGKMRVNIEKIAKSLSHNKGNISAVAKELNHDRKTVRKWSRRCRSIYQSNYFSFRNVSHKSTKPKKIHYRLTIQQEARVITLRETRHFDQVKIANQIFKQYGVKVSGKTVYNVIKRKRPGLITPRRKYLRPRFQNGRHMRPANTEGVGYLQADVKYVTPELSGLDYTTYEFAYIDIYSRYKVAWIMPTVDQEAGIVALRHAINQMPFKVKFIQTDNGWENGSRYHEECLKQGIEHYYIHKSSPNENAVIERTFRTDQDEFFYWLRKVPVDLNELNIWFQEFLKFYNEERPHLGLNLRTPLEVINLFKGGEYVVT